MLPPFNADDPQLWFAQAAVQFSVNGVQDDNRKFAYVQNCLAPVYAREVRDVLMEPPSTDRYDKLKRELVKRLSQSQEEMTRRLLQTEEIGDRKPSQFLRHLQSLSGNSVDNQLLRSIWTSRMPKEIQPLLAIFKKSTLDELAEAADEAIQTMRGSRTTIASTKISTPPPSWQSEIAQLSAKFDALSRQVAESPGYRGRSSDRQRPRNYERRRSRTRSRPRNSDYCWYHNRFGDKAKRCTSPCSFAKN